MGTQRICSVEGCGKPIKNRTWCSAHYQKWQAYGDPLGKPAPRPPKPTICQAPGCSAPPKAAGLCWPHYTRKNKNGTFEISRSTSKDMRQFFANALVSETDECIIWPYGKDAAGYGLLTINGKQKPVNVHVCTALYGPANGRVSCHACHNKACCNPRHLRWGTHKDNAQDSIAVGNWQRGERNGHAKLTADDVAQIRASTETPTVLGKRYNVTPGYICQLRQRTRAWKHTA